MKIIKSNFCGFFYKFHIVNVIKLSKLSKKFDFRANVLYKMEIWLRGLED